MKSIQTWFDEHRSFLLLLLFFVSLRLCALILLRPGGFIADNSDFEFYYAWGQLLPMGTQPFVNSWSTYPPLFTGLMLPAFELASRIPPWSDARLWFHIVFGFELLLFDIGNIIVIYRLSRRIEHKPTNLSGNQPAVLYALLFLPLYIMLGFFEVMPLFFLLLGVDLLTVRGRVGWIASAVAIGLGFLIKLTPIILVPVAIRWLWQRNQDVALHQENGESSYFHIRLHIRHYFQPLLYSLITVWTILGVGYPLAHGNLELGLSSLKIQSIRPPWQSIWALIDGYYGFGLVPLDVRNLSALNTYQWQSNIPWTAVTLVFGLAFLWLYTRAFDWKQIRTVIGFTAISMIGLLLYSKGWSPQFLVWVLAFVVILLPSAHSLVIAVLLMLVNVVESFIYLVILPDQRWLLWGTVIARTVLLLVLVLDFLSVIWHEQKTAASILRWSRRLGWASVLAVIVSAIVAFPKANNVYWANQLAAHPCPGVVEKLQQERVWPNHTIVTNRVENWQQLYPWLRNDYDFIVIDNYGLAEKYPDEPLDDTVRKVYADRIPNGEFWYVGRGPDDIFSLDLPISISMQRTTYNVVDLETDEVAPSDGESQWSRCVLMRLYKSEISEKSQIATPSKPYGLLDNSIRLADVQLGAPKIGAAFRFTLYWQPWLPTKESYTVFTQLIDPAGALIAQKDNLPVQGLAPTNTWTAPLIRDSYELVIPADVLPGSYQLYVGMYDANQQRLPITLADGSVVDHFTFPIELTTQ